MSTVWSQVVGQPEAVAVLRASAKVAASMVDGTFAGGSTSAVAHAWLFTGPPGSGRSVAARAFAAALQCEAGEGCGSCSGCRTAMAGTHADVHVVEPEGLSISVSEMRSLVQIAARRPTGARWQVVIITDADRLTEGAANALLKAVEEPPDRTVFLLAAPSDHPEDVPVTIRSRCRHLGLRTPSPTAIAEVLRSRDSIEPTMAAWAASVCGGHVGRARRLATDEAARTRRESVLRIPLNLRTLADVFSCADDLVKAAEADATQVSGNRDEAEKEALKTAMGHGGTGKGTATATRGSAAAIKELERRQKSRATRTQRDAIDLALVDLAAFYRDVLVVASGSQATLNHPDRERDSRQAAGLWSQESTLRRLEAVLACREAMELNVKPRIAIEAMLSTLYHG